MSDAISPRRPDVRRLTGEFVGTAFLLAAVVGSGIMAETLSTDVGLQLLQNAVATAGVLTALILTFGSVSGAHFNPAVTIADRVFGGIDISGEQPQRWTDEQARAADVVVTMGCGDVCPVYPGKRYEDWELTDPAGRPVEFVRTVRDEIRERVEQLIAGLSGLS